MQSLPCNWAGFLPKNGLVSLCANLILTYLPDILLSVTAYLIHWLLIIDQLCFDCHCVQLQNNGVRRRQQSHRYQVQRNGFNRPDHTQLAQDRHTEAALEAALEAYRATLPLILERWYQIRLDVLERCKRDLTERDRAFKATWRMWSDPRFKTVLLAGLFRGR